MSLLLIIAALFVLTGLFGVINERYLRLQPSIGLMLLALVMSLGFLGLWSASSPERSASTSRSPR